MNGKNIDKPGITIMWKIVEQLMSWKKFIIIFTCIVTLVALLIAFVLPKEYRATAKVLPSLKSDVFGLLGGTSLGSLAKDLTPLMGNKLGMNTGYNYLSILNSNRALMRLIDKYDLMKVYSIKDSSYEKTLNKLRENFFAEIDEYGAVEISVYDRDPHQAASMANDLVDILNEISRELSSQDAKNNREFIEGRLQKVREDLAQAEDSLRVFQEKSGMVITPEQSSALVAVAELYGMKAKKEVEYAILKKSVTPNNELLQQLSVEINELEKKLATIPSAGLSSIRLYRDVLIQQRIVEYLYPLYEQAKLQEAQDTPSVLVLDRAISPERKARPPRLLIVLSGFFIGLFLSAAIILAIEKIVQYSEQDSGKFQLSCKKIATRIQSKIRPKI
jgi:uncharacterized protein involved in exopolysaccharide biosynthesis